MLSDRSIVGVLFCDRLREDGPPPAPRDRPLTPSPSPLRGRGEGEGARGGGDGGRAGAPLTVTLTEQELLTAAMIGAMRQIRNVLARFTPIVDSNFGGHITGAIAELGVAKALNKFFPAGFRQTDVGEYEVRATTHKDGSLIVRDRDSSATTYVLAIVDVPKVVIVGAIEGWEAKDSKYLRAPNGGPGAYFVPQSALRPIVSSH